MTNGWYHGGPTKAALKGWILPASNLGKDIAYPDVASYRRDRVYVTEHLHLAIEFAAKVPNQAGAVFEVEPIGDLTPDEHYEGTVRSAYLCERARIIRRAKVPGKVMKRARRDDTELRNALRTAGWFDERDPDRCRQILEEVTQRIATARVRGDTEPLAFYKGP